MLNLLLTLGVIRRLREHTELLTRPAQHHGGPGTPVGEEVGDFQASTVDGQPVARADLAAAAGETFVAVLTPHCRPCTEKLPALAAHLRARSGGALVVVVGDAGEAADMLATLSPVARVVVDKPGGPVATAFQATAFPTMLTVAPDGAGRLRATANLLDVPTHSG